MAKFILKNAWVQINSVNLSDHVKSVTVESVKATADVTAMGDTATQRALGLNDDKFTVRFLQDFAASEVDATLWPLYNGGSTFLVETAADGTAISSTNPKFSASCIMENYQPIAGDVASAAEVDVTFLAQAAIARATA